MNYHDSNELDDIFNTMHDLKSNDVKCNKIKIENKAENTVCIHISEKIDGIEICTLCGNEVLINFGVENKYTITGNKTSRFSTKTENKKGIKTLLDTITNLPKDIYEESNQEFCEFFTDISRGKKLRGIVFAIVFNKAKEKKVSILAGQLYKDLGINKKIASDGKKEYTAKIGKKKIIVNFISAKDYIPDMVKKFGCNEYDIKNIVNIYETIKGKSQQINSSTPKSLCAAMIYYYYMLLTASKNVENNKKKISIDEFSKTVELSTLTIQKLGLHIQEVVSNLQIK